MSIVTKTGDAGTTALMYNRRVPKSHPRVEAYGGVDELTAALGVARATAADERLRRQIFRIQKELVHLMAELATDIQDLPRFLKDGLPRITAESVAELDRCVREVEQGQQAPLRGWAIPGANPEAAGLDMARTICRRAERRVCALQESGQLQNSEIIVYLNRLSDLLWLLARRAEAGPATLEPGLV
jgi:cob(I)alamin adenosyltransferase